MSASASEALAHRLAAMDRRSTLRITTRGRRTGKPHTVTIWFVVDDATVYLSTLKARRDWVRNLTRTPDVTLEAGDMRFQGRARTVTDPIEDARIRSRLAAKYWVARIGSWLGIAPERTFRVDEITAA
jgi:deazaflavin-dependent oxidoreductase (nitroreductase family)